MLDSLIAQPLLPLAIAAFPLAGATMLIVRSAQARTSGIAATPTADAATTVPPIAERADPEVTDTTSLRTFATSDLLNAPAAILLTLPVATIIMLRLGWSMSLVPLLIVPPVAAWFGARLRRTGVRHAHIYAWTALAAPSIAWSATVLLQLDAIEWGKLGYDSVRITYGEQSLVGGTTRLAIGTVAAVVLVAASVGAAARRASRFASTPLGLASVPLLAQIWLTAPLGFVISAWTVAVIGFALTRLASRRDALGALSEDVPVNSLTGEIRAVAGISETLRSPATQAIALLACIAFALGSVFRALPSESLIAALGPWIAFACVGAYGYRGLRRERNSADALRLAATSQLVALLALTAVWGSIWLLDNGIDFSAEGINGAYALILLELIALGIFLVAYIAYVAATEQLAHVMPIVTGVSWPVILAYCLNVHGIEPTGSAWAFDWLPAQTWSTLVATTAAVALIWYGTSVGAVASRPGDARTPYR